MQPAAGQLRCQCAAGFSGSHCEINQRCPCQNGGTCINDPANPFQSSCHCPLNFSGRHCENNLPRTRSCPYRQCEQLSGDKLCDEQCNNHDCRWDGGDCSLNWKEPWANCTAPVPCWDLFKNGQCDKECDNPGCLFDSFECQVAPEEICKYVLVARERCKNEIWGWEF